MDFLKTRLSELLASVVNPLWAWVLSRSWIVRAALLVLFSAAISAWYNPTVWSTTYDSSVLGIREIFSGGRRLPLPAAVSAVNRRTISRLRNSVLNDFGDLGPLTPWSVSQALTGLGEAGAPVEDRDRLLAFVRAGHGTGCFCWTELKADSTGAEHIAISGWVLAAYASAGVAPTAEELQSLLALQNGQGWWPVFPDIQGREGAFTYSTAWMAMGLMQLRDRRLVPPGMAPQVDRAIRGATTWLMMTREGEARWKDYPYHRFGKVSPAISGMVLHVLHRAALPDLEELDQAWLSSLPAPTSPAVVELDMRYVELPTSHGVRIDHLTQVPMAWLIVATADAYDNGSFRQRSAALEWLTALTGHPSVMTADATANNWWRAELLYALAHLQSRLG